MRPDFKLIDNPYDPGRRILVVPAINPEIGLLHALRADLDGNVVSSGRFDPHQLAHASRRVIVTVEEVRADALAVLRSDEIVIPSIYLEAVAVAPLGAHPLACPGRYGRDLAGIREYVTACRDDASFAGYLRRTVYDCPDHEAYLTAAGLLAAAQ